MDSVKMKDGDKLIYGLSYSFPEGGWVSVDVELVDRKWWQFYLPKRVHLYFKVVNEKDEN